MCGLPNAYDVVSELANYAISDNSFPLPSAKACFLILGFGDAQ